MFFKKVMIGCLISLGFAGTCAQQTLRDPFQFYLPATANQNFSQTPIKQLQLLGVMSVDDKQFALLSTMHAAVFRWVRLGDHVGIEKAVITQIQAKTIVVKEKIGLKTKTLRITNASSV